jgi:uroporphyrinogen decarboxylase
LNPVQVAAENMDTAQLKGEFYDYISFCGAIDTQQLSSFGGYVLTSIHNIEADVPGENILAMINAARRLSKYALQYLEG